MKATETKIQKRFADIDVFGHVNNIHQQEYLDLGKTDYYTNVLGLDALTDVPTLMIVAVKTDFLEQVRWADDTIVRTRVERIGSKSITLRQEIVSRSAAVSPANTAPTASATPAPEKVCTESLCTLVCFDRHAQRTCEIPAPWREKIGEQ